MFCKFCRLKLNESVWVWTSLRLQRARKRISVWSIHSPKWCFTNAETMQITNLSFLLKIKLVWNLQFCSNYWITRYSLLLLFSVQAHVLARISLSSCSNIVSFPILLLYCNPSEMLPVLWDLLQKCVARSPGGMLPPLLDFVGRNPVATSLCFGQHGKWQITTVNCLTTSWPAVQAPLWEQASGLSWGMTPVAVSPSQWDGPWSLPALQWAILERLSLITRPQPILPQHTHTPRAQQGPLRDARGFNVNIWLNLRGILDGFLYTHRCSCMQLFACVHVWELVMAWMFLSWIHI